MRVAVGVGVLVLVSRLGPTRARDTNKGVGVVVRGSTLDSLPVARVVPRVLYVHVSCSHCMSCTCYMWVRVPGPQLLHYSRLCLQVAGWCTLAGTPWFHASAGVLN